MRSSNPLTPFDFPMTHPPAACPQMADAKDDANPQQHNPSTMQPVPTMQLASSAAKPGQTGLGISAMQPIPAMQLAQFQDVEVVVSRGALGGWVEQASPACGAASVAGAWNAVKPQGSFFDQHATFVAFRTQSRFLFCNSMQCIGWFIMHYYPYWNRTVISIPCKQFSKAMPTELSSKN